MPPIPIELDWAPVELYAPDAILLPSWDERTMPKGPPSKGALEQAANQLGIPAWGRVLIWVVFIVDLAFGSAFVTSFWQLHAVNRDIGRLEGKIDELPLKLSQTLLRESQQAASAGNRAEAAKSIQVATALITGARREKIRAGAEYFKQVSEELKSLESSDPTRELQTQLHNARVELAAYRSALESQPKLPGTREPLVAPKVLAAEKRIDSSSLPSSVVDATALPPGSDILETPFTRRLANNIFIANLTFVGGSQTLDGIHWYEVVFVNTHIKYAGGEVELRNVRFVNCTFEIINNERGEQLAEYEALRRPSLRIG